MKARNELVKKCEELMIKYQEDAMRAQGLMTSRGVYEQKLKFVYNELSLGKRFNASEACAELTYVLSKLDSKEISNIHEITLQRGTKVQLDIRKHTTDMLHYARKCQFQDFAKFYSKVSNAIHGYEWSGSSVKILKEKLAQNEIGVIKEICKGFLLEFDTVDEV